MISRLDRKMFQDRINDRFLRNLTYMLKLNPERVDEHYDTCLSISYKEFRHYPNYWACRKGLSMVSKVVAWGYLE